MGSCILFNICIELIYKQYFTNLITTNQSHFLKEPPFLIREWNGGRGLFPYNLDLAITKKDIFLPYDDNHELEDNFSHY